MFKTPKRMLDLEDDPRGKVLTPQPRRAEDVTNSQRKKFPLNFLDVVS